MKRRPPKKCYRIPEYTAVTRNRVHRRLKDAIDNAEYSLQALDREEANEGTSYGLTRMYINRTRNKSTGEESYGAQSTRSCRTGVAVATLKGTKPLSGATIRERQEIEERERKRSQ